MPEKSQVAYCGLFCGNCIIRQGKVNELSKELLQKIETPEFKKLANGLPKVNPELFSAFGEIDKLIEILKAMLNVDCYRFCKEGGGSSNCHIRKCCQEKGIEGCWNCQFFEKCEILSWLDPVHERANILNLQIIRDKGMQTFLSLKEKHW